MIRAAISMTLLLGCARGGAAAPVPSLVSPVPSASAVVPRSDRAYHCMDVLRRAGIINAFPDGTGGNVPEKRNQFAIAVARLLPLLSPSQDLSPEPVALRRGIHQTLVQNPEALAALLTLMDEFMSEIREYAPGVTQVREQLVELQKTFRPFPDVPKDHWAYQAVEAVRRAGIMVGYPRGDAQKD